MTCFFQLRENILWRKEAGVFILLHPESKELKIYNPRISESISAGGIIIENEHTAALLEELRRLGMVTGACESPVLSSDAPGFTAPFNVTIQTTNRCNLQCPHCHRDRKGKEDLPLHHFESLIRQLKEMRVFNVNLSGGEPTLLEDISLRVQLINLCGLKVTMSTNNTLLTPQLAESLHDAGLRDVHISLDSIAKEHDLMRGVEGAYQMMVDRLPLLRKVGIRYTFVTTIVSQTPEAYENVIDLAYSLGADAHKTNTLIPQGGGGSLPYSGTTLACPGRIEPFIQIFKRKRAEYKSKMNVSAETMFQLQMSGHDPAVPVALNIGCPAGVLTCAIREDGDLLPCPFFPSVTAGNVFQESFRELWNRNPLLLSLRRRDLISTCGNCRLSKSCGGCRARSYGITGNLFGNDPYCSVERFNFGDRFIRASE